MKKEIDLSLFDVREYLDDRNVSWATEGKNISSGWIGLSCPFCSDASNHLGINLRTLSVSCWKCGKNGNILKLIMAIDDCSFGKALSIIPKFVLTDFSHLIQPKRAAATNIIFPSGILTELSDKQKAYLEKRRYDPIQLQRKYDIVGMGPTLDDWKFRIIIPVYINNELVTYVGKDITGKLETPYKNAAIEKSIKQAKHCLYNIDSVKNKKALIVEGLFDVWRMGPGVIGTFGTKYTPEQLLLIKEQGIETCFIMFDGRKDDNGEAIKQAHKMANDLSGLINYVEVLELDEGDPDNLTDDEVWQLRKDLELNS